jgi:hypothetical protein
MLCPCGRNEYQTKALHLVYCILLERKGIILRVDKVIPGGPGIFPMWPPDFSSGSMNLHSSQEPCIFYKLLVILLLCLANEI